VSDEYALRDLDVHVLYFPVEGPPVWRVLKSEERLAEERFAKEVCELKVNRSEKRAHVGPGSVVDVPCAGVDRRAMTRSQRAATLARQGSLFAVKSDVDDKGRRVRRAGRGAQG
jgi:hypothetical protein